MAADTLAIVHLLEAAGVERGVAEAHATAIQTAVDHRQENLATKADLDVRLAAVEAQIAAVETQVAAVEARLTWRMAGLVVAAVALLGVLIRL